MPRIYLCFLWHMHQPFYKNLVSGEYRLPWTRMHALKDYYGMVKILEEFPEVKQTFNLVPSMMVQVEEYARGDANDPFLRVALKPAELLTADEQAFILHNFFMANPERMIYRYPRYGELFTAHRNGGAAFGPQDFRDLQVLSQVAWFDEEFQEHDTEVRGLVEKGRNFSPGDQALMGRKQREILALVIPQYRKLAATGQIEISTTPFYHPILPLICDSDIAQVSHPHLQLPERFRYPGDARLQLERARDYIEKTFGVAPVGMWPSEGSVSDEALGIAADCGFGWAATDNGVLERTLGAFSQGASPDVSYKPYKWMRDGRGIGMIFRDHLMSDLIGFVYSGMDSGAAARDFLRRIHDNCAGILAHGRDAMVPIILDGENAWEYYDRNGRPFFRELYGGIQADPNMEAITVREAFLKMQPDPLLNIFPGSWINANFDVWIGAEEDNKAWRLLLDARRAFDTVCHSPAGLPQRLSEQSRELAMEEIMIAEGSDWNWWYGPEHDSENREEFDQIYREHLANVYRALGLGTPAELSQPILRSRVRETFTRPARPIRPVVDGMAEADSQWAGAGVYALDQKDRAMHGSRKLLKELLYGSDGTSIYVRVDFAESGSQLEDLEIQIYPESGTLQLAVIRLQGGRAVTISGTSDRAHAAFRDVLEISVKITEGVQGIRLSFWQDGLPIRLVPKEGSLRADTGG